MADIGLLRGIYQRARAELNEHYRAAEPLLEKLREAEKALFDALRERGELWVLEIHRYGTNDSETEEYLTLAEASGMAKALEDSDNGYPLRLTGPEGFDHKYD